MESSSTPSNEDRDFISLFWEAQNDHRLFKEDAHTKGEAHKAALAYALKFDWKWAETLLIASNLIYSNKDQEGFDLLSQLDFIVPPQFQGLKYYLLAIASVYVNKLDEAIDISLKCIADPSFDSPTMLGI